MNIYKYLKKECCELLKYSWDEMLTVSIKEKRPLINTIQLIQEKKERAFSHYEKLFEALVIESPFEPSKKIMDMIRKQMEIEKGSKELYVENKDLIGGFRATYKGRVVDGSIKHNLAILKKELTN